MAGSESTYKENRHEPGADPTWEESWHLDFWSEKAEVGGYVHMAVLPNTRKCRYWACLVGSSRTLVSVIDKEAPTPKAPGLEFRASGLWTDLIVQTPMEHMTVGLEAFGVALEDPTEVYRKGWGDREALGFDLEWETMSHPFDRRDGDGYELACKVHGEILVGSEVLDLDGWGRRSHRWGNRNWWGATWLEVSARLDDGTPVYGEMVDGDGTSQGFVGAGADPISVGAASHVEREDGLPSSARLRLDDLYLATEALAWAPASLEGARGETAHLARALVRCTAGDGRTGVGWLELNQPQPTLSR